MYVSWGQLRHAVFILVFFFSPCVWGGLLFGIQGLGEIEIMSSPQSLVEFNTEVETFCKQNTFQSNFPRHRCEWLTAGPLLQALSTQDGWNASIVRNFFLKFEAAERWVYPEEDIRKLRSCRGNGRRTGGDGAVRPWHAPALHPQHPGARISGIRAGSFCSSEHGVRQPEYHRVAGLHRRV